MKDSVSDRKAEKVAATQGNQLKEAVDVGLFIQYKPYIWYKRIYMHPFRLEDKHLFRIGL